MLLLVDGSNVLGRLGKDLRSVEEKRKLAQALAQLARKDRLRVICFFDGPPPQENFATRIGSVEVRFTGTASADDRIVALALETKEALRVMTADRGLEGRVRGRRVEVVSPSILWNVEGERGASDATDWESYFSDPNNRNI